MLDFEALYNAVSKGSVFKVIFGGTALPADFENGTILLTPLTAKPLTRSDRIFKEIDSEGNIYQKSKDIVTIQCDIYKINKPNINYIEAQVEALRMQEFLKGFDVSEILKEAKMEILPNFENIQFLVEYGDSKELINRATFTFSVIIENKIKQKVDFFDKISFENQIV